jgi:hypothetical protein
MSYRTSEETAAMRAPLINGQHWLDPKDWQMLTAIIKYAHHMDDCKEAPYYLFHLRAALTQEYKYGRKDESIALKKMRTY